MPVTIRTQPIDGDLWLKSTTTDAHKILHHKISPEALTGKGLMQSSFSKNGQSSSFTGNNRENTGNRITPSINGLVHSTIEAWNNHHHLVIRPDDIWLCILSQLGFFIDAHANEPSFRSFFVSHEGKKTLTVGQVGTPDSVDYATFARDMTKEIADNIKDPGMVPWILPSFSTTTENDTVVAAVLFMGAMQKYFDYLFCCFTCGIPSITLLGTREDWVDLEGRIKKIRELPHDEAGQFCDLLEPIARNFVKTFDEPFSKEILEFWRLIVSRETPRYSMSGGPSQLLTGWIVSFCFWTEEGKKNRFARDEDSLVRIDEIEYPAIDPKNVVTGWGSVPVTVKWFDSGVLVEERKCKMVAGSVGMRPGRHVDLGVRLEGVPIPEREGIDEEREEKKKNKFEKTSLYGDYGATETPAARRKRRFRQPDGREDGAPDAKLGFDAVMPEVGWWIFEASEKDEGKGEEDY